jgi:hypothetical protein
MLTPLAGERPVAWREDGMRAWFPGVWAWDGCSTTGWFVVEPSGEFCVTTVGSDGEQCTSFGTWEADDAEQGTWRATPAFVSAGLKLAPVHRCQHFTFDGPDALLMATVGRPADGVRLVRTRPTCDA